MTPNTTFFADFIKGARTTANLTQDNLHDRGASYRQLQGRIENGDLIELEDGVLAAYDRAYGWPLGYAAAVAQAAAYASGAEAPAVNLAEGGNEGGHPGMAGHPAPNTLAALYEPGRHSAPPAIGFDPATGRAVYIGPGILTNIAFRELQAVLNSRWGATLLDTQVLDEGVVRRLADSERPQRFYRLGADEGALLNHGGVVTPIALDALTDITTLKEARALAQALLELFPVVQTTVERAAFTFLVIAAFGEDPFTTIRRLQEGGRFAFQDRADFHPDLAEFREFWAKFRERHDGSAELAAPDHEALRLLDHLSRSREAAKSIEIGSPRTEGQRFGRAELPQTVRTTTLLFGNEENENVIFYDSDVAPQVPVCLNSIAVAATLAIYRVREAPGLAWLSNPRLTYRSIGIAADADDLSLVARHRPDHVDTLTNTFGRYAVFCESGRAGVVWIPGT